MNVQEIYHQETSDLIISDFKPSISVVGITQTGWLDLRRQMQTIGGI